MNLIKVDDYGLRCDAGDFWIDPWRPVETAVVKHAHADHARPGSKRYICSAAQTVRAIPGAYRPTCRARRNSPGLKRRMEGMTMRVVAVAAANPMVATSPARPSRMNREK